MLSLKEVQSSGCPVHVLITAPNAIYGTEEQRLEIARSLPKPEEGHIWQYQAMAPQPLRFETKQDVVEFWKELEQKLATDKWFVPVMRFDQLRKKWVINKKWADAVGELAVFMQVKGELVPLKEESGEPDKKESAGPEKN